MGSGGIGEERKVGACPDRHDPARDGLTARRTVMACRTVTVRRVGGVFRPAVTGFRTRDGGSASLR